MRVIVGHRAVSPGEWVFAQWILASVVVVATGDWVCGCVGVWMGGEGGGGAPFLSVCGGNGPGLRSSSSSARRRHEDFDRFRDSDGHANDTDDDRDRYIVPQPASCRPLDGAITLVCVRVDHGRPFASSLSENYRVVEQRWGSVIPRFIHIHCAVWFFFLPLVNLQRRLVLWQ